jgi:uncharacterized membrane protein YqaE (UPF0057 family)
MVTLTILEWRKRMGFWRIVFTIILPPLGVLLGKGLGWAFIINIILTLLGYIPGLIHAFWVQTKSDA